jgi:hypothetical protein
VIKEYQDEYFVRHALILDTFAQKDQAVRLEAAVSVAASFACSIQTQESLLDLIFVEDKSYCFTSGRGLFRLEKLLEILALVTACSKKPFSVLDTAASEHASQLSSCIIILLEWNQERKEMVEHLTTWQVPMLVLVMTEEESFSAATDDRQDLPDNCRYIQVNNLAKGLMQL